MQLAWDGYKSTVKVWQCCPQRLQLLCTCVQDILLHDDITGLLGPSLKALKAAHAVTAEMSAAGQLVLTNMRSVSVS